MKSLSKYQCFKELGKKNPKIYMESQKSLSRQREKKKHQKKNQKTKTNPPPHKKNPKQQEAFMLPDFKIYHKAIVIKTT
jgi:hypothetical protein